jgi:DNA-binding transcriptional LysR family regulator
MMERGVLDDLAAFAAVARARSFTRAAPELGLSTSALSYTIKKLETRLGARLLQRNSRNVSVTRAGERLLQTLGPALADIGDALDDLGRERSSVRGAVRLTMTRQAFEAVIRPALAEFSESHPEATLEVLIEYDLRDIIAGRLDAGIRIGEKLEQDMIAMRVSPEIRMAVVASPAFLAGQSALESPRDLNDRRSIGYRMRADGGLLPWDFERDGRQLQVTVGGPLVVNEPEVALDAALDGLGYAYVMEERARPYLSDGRLVRLLEEWTPPFPGFFLYHASRRQTPPALAALINLLRKRSRLDPTAPPAIDRAPRDGEPTPPASTRG